MTDDLSQRGCQNLNNIMSRVPKSILEGIKGKKSADGKVDSVDLATAENYLLRDEVLEIGKAAINNDFATHHLSLPVGFWGDPDLLEALAALFNQYFHPRVPVQTTHLAAAPGTAYSLDAILYNICDAGEGVLVPSPYWNGYDIFFSIRSSVIPVVVPIPDFEESLSLSLIPAIEKAYSNASCKIRALVLTNPHNPLGRCYPKSVLEACLKFCQAKNIHLLSDEVFALSTFECDDLPSPEFISVLSLDAAALGCDPSRVHAVWSPSKDFGTSGIKLGCTITQSNNNLRNGLALAAHVNVSTLSSVFATKLLKSPLLPSLIALNSTRLAESYMTLATFLKSRRIEYFPSNVGVFVFARLASTAQSWEDEALVVQKLEDAGVLVSAGRRYHIVQKGWARVSFAVDRTVMEEAIRRMETVFDAVN